MRKLTLAFVCLCSLCLFGQNSISGSFTPAKDYSWLIAYRLKPGTQVYVADTAIENGRFELKMPADAPKGIYRLVYALPQEEFYFDVIYDQKAPVELKFDAEQGVVFTASTENILFGTYFREINALEGELVRYYTQGRKDTKDYSALLAKLATLQESYEKKSEGLIAHQFIRANRPYIPAQYEAVEDYVSHRKQAYFKHLNLSNEVLQGSGFLSDKLANYVFTALPAEPLDALETEQQIIANVNTVYEKLAGASEAFAFHILYSLWAQSSASGLNKVADFIYSKYMKASAASTTNNEIMAQIEVHNRLRLGAQAPEIVLKPDREPQKLSALQGYENYLLVFWSSTCGHCLKELPALHNELKQYNAVKVIAVGLEDDDTTWNIEAAKLESFEHLIALGKWESDYAQLYDIQATPTYFILDHEKKIIAKPESDKEVVAFLRKQ